VSETECFSCDHQCDASDVKCEDGAVSSCVADTNTGCRDWAVAEDCQSGACDSETECTPFDPCADHECQNGATCEPDGDDYSCDCADGFSGPNCETNIDECADEPCENN